MSLGISLFYPQIFQSTPLSTKVLYIYIYVTDRSSGSRIILLAAPSHSACSGTVTFCGVRSRLQRRARSRFARDFLLSPLGHRVTFHYNMQKTASMSRRIQPGGVYLELTTDSCYPCPWRRGITIAIVIVFIKYILYSAKKTQHLKAVFGPEIGCRIFRNRLCII